MTDRRKFLVKSGMTATALLVLRPFKGFASSSFDLFDTAYGNKLVLLHTGNNPKHLGYAGQKISALKKRKHNLLLIDEQVSHVPGENYRLVDQGNYKTGIIQAYPGDSIIELNKLSSLLKRDNNCRLVICVSSFGFKNNKGPDDLSLAEKSADIDIIIGNHPTNHKPFPVVARNRKKAEVIIHSAADNGFGLGNIEIEYDDITNARKTISFNNLLERLPENA